MQKRRIIQETIVLVMLIALVGLANAMEKPGISIQVTPIRVIEAGPTGIPQAVAVSPVCNLINFEGLGNNQPIGKVVGSVTVTFGSSWLSLLDNDAGGVGNFANEPSPSTTAYFLDQNDISITFDPGVQSIEFWYSAAAQSLPVHVIAYDEEGNLVDDNIGNAVGTDYDGASCTGDPNGNFCSFSKLTLESTANNIKRIEIIGTVSNFFGIDDLRYCRAQCSPEEGEGEQEEISGFGSCGPEGIKTPTWGKFGKKQELVADSGEKLVIECFNDDSLLYFVLLYTAPGEPTRKIGMCPFLSGCNSTYIWHSGDRDGNGKPDCFVRTRWISRDYGKNDKPNGWTSEGDFPLENLIPPKIDLLDWAESVFDVNTRMLTKTDLKYEYTYGPPVNACAGGPSPEGNLFSKQPLTSSLIDPLLGPETEAFYDAVIDRLRSLPPESIPMGEDTTPKCDFNRDGVCDDQDILEFEANLGKCYWELGYNPFADIDGNGCLTESDLLDYLPPQVTIITPAANKELHDGVTFQAQATYASGIDKVFFYLREPDGGSGTPIGYDDLKASYNSTSGNWEYPFDTTKLQDGYYVIFAKATDNDGVEGVSTVVPFSIRNGATAITLASFTAEPESGKVVLAWTSGDETNNFGFNVYRADSQDGEYIKMNSFIIASKVSSRMGTSYEFIDDNVKNRKTYYYKLEDIDVNGAKTMHGPVSATPRLIFGLGK